MCCVRGEGVWSLVNLWCSNVFLRLLLLLRILPRRYQPRGERNFHIFYQLVKAASPAQRADLELPPAGPRCCEQFHYMNQSGCVNVKGLDDDGDDGDLCFKATMNGFTGECVLLHRQRWWWWWG